MYYSGTGGNDGYDIGGNSPNPYAILIFDNGDEEQQNFGKLNEIAEIPWKKDRKLSQIIFHLPLSYNYITENYVEVKELWLWEGPCLNSMIDGDITGTLFASGTVANLDQLDKTSLIVTAETSGTCIDILANDDIQIYLKGEFTVKDVIVIPCDENADDSDTMELVYSDVDTGQFEGHWLN